MMDMETAEMVTATLSWHDKHCVLVLGTGWETGTEDKCNYTVVIKNWPLLYFQMISINIGQYQQFLVAPLARCEVRLK